MLMNLNRNLSISINLLIQRTVLSKSKAILSKEMMDAKLEKKKKKKKKKKKREVCRKETFIRK